MRGLTERKRVDEGIVCTVADRWARHVRAVADSAGDLRTVAAWARFVGISKTSLSDMCRLLKIRPRDARDLSRVLRIVAQSTNISTDAAALLDVCDQRTLEKLLARAGLPTATGYVSMRQLLERQRFVPVHNVGMIRLAELVGDR